MPPEPFFGSDLINENLAQTCLSLYRKVLQAVYIETRPKLNLDDIIEDDKWRYEELPKALENAESLSKAQLARLVKWKITHGIHRPFLPGMIQKNNEAEVQEHTRKATTLIKDIRHDQDATATITAIETALKQVCNLKGVGPATGTLVLSIVQPKIVPFFEDELYFWLHPGHLGKLKYDKAEYRSLLTKALNIILKKNVEAHALEKTAYVLMHADKLSDAAKEQLKRCLDTPVAHVPAEKPGKVTATASPRLPNIKPSKDEQRLAVNRSKQARGRHKSDEEDSASLRRSKRRKI